jgi:precorrin-6A/cobalt-precorrin-6A reductase
MSRPRPLRVLILGGTTEARRLAEALAGRPDVDAAVSLAGRTAEPAALPLPVRVGGFGGAEGLAAFLRAERIDRLIDATHPFAARMSANAVAAAARAGVPLLAVERPPWVPGPGDRWTEVDALEDAPAALGETPRRVFLGIGRLHLALFAAAPRHAYVARLIDPPDGPPPLPRLEVIVARGPFDAAGDAALFRDRGVEVVVGKNAGGEGARAKLDAARALGLPVVLARRPAIPARETVATAAEAVRRLGLPPSTDGRG